MNSRPAIQPLAVFVDNSANSMLFSVSTPGAAIPPALPTGNPSKQQQTGTGSGREYSHNTDANTPGSNPKAEAIHAEIYRDVCGPQRTDAESESRHGLDALNKRTAGRDLTRDERRLKARYESALAEQLAEEIAHFRAETWGSNPLKTD